MSAADDDFDLQAAWLRRFQADAQSNLGALAQRLKEAMPEQVTLKEEKKFLARSGRIVGVSVRIGDADYILNLQNGRLQAKIAMIVRNIVLNTKDVDPAEWFRRLNAEAREASAHARSLSQSLSAFMAS